MVRDESSARLKRIVLSLDPITQVSLPVESTTQVRVTSSPTHAELPAKLDVIVCPCVASTKVGSKIPMEISTKKTLTILP